MPYSEYSEIHIHVLLGTPSSPDHSRRLQGGFLALTPTPPEALAKSPLLQRAPEFREKVLSSCTFSHSWRVGCSPMAPRAPLCLELTRGVGRPQDFADGLTSPALRPCWWSPVKRHKRITDTSWILIWHLSSKFPWRIKKCSLVISCQPSDVWWGECLSSVRVTDLWRLVMMEV